MPPPSLVTPKAPLANLLEGQLAARIREHGLVVWPDAEGVYSGFVDRLTRDFFAPIVSYRGSYLELLLELEDRQTGLDPEPMVLYLPRHNKESLVPTPLLEFYRAGNTFEKNFTTLLREAAAGLVPPERIQAEVSSIATFEEGETWLRGGTNTETSAENRFLPLLAQPEAFVLRLLGTPEELLGRPLAPDDYPQLLDAWALASGMLPDLRDRLLALDPHQVDQVVVGWLLLMEYVFDLKRAPVEGLKELRELKAFRPICDRCLKLVREQLPARYRELADLVETLEVVQRDLRSGTPDELGKIDTFSQEDWRLLEASLEALGRGDWSQAAEWADQRLKSPSPWLEPGRSRANQWSVVGVSAQLGQAIETERDPLKGVTSLEDSVDRYAGSLFQVDQKHRRFEQDLRKLLDPRDRFYEGLHRETGRVRGLYHRWLDTLAERFSALCEEQGFLPPAHLQQRELYAQVVHPLTQSPEPMALFLVDAMRFEMAAELLDDLEEPLVVAHLKPRLAELPTVTEVGMNALAPVADAGRLLLDNKPFSGFVRGSFSVRNYQDRLRAMGEQSLQRSPRKRKTPLRYELRQILEMEPKLLRDAVTAQAMVVVICRDLDKGGEQDLGPTVFEAILGELRSAVRCLHRAGIRKFVLTSDHGFLLPDSKVQPIRYDRGKVTRRYVLSDHSVTTDGLSTVALQELSYSGSGSYLMFARDSRSFQLSGDTAVSFYHGGNSLQERVIPVLTLDFAPPNISQKFHVEAGLVDSSQTLFRLRLLVRRDGQLVLTASGTETVTLAFRFPELEGQPQLLAAEGAQVVNQQLRVTVEKEVPDVVLTTSKSLAPGTCLEIFHPDGEHDIAATQLVLVPVSSEPSVPSDGGGWTTLASQSSLKILEVLEKHGSISEVEIVQLVGTTRAERKFSNELDKLRPHLPFKVRIDTTQGKRYLKE